MLNKKVLIVEDESILRDAYAMVLNRHGYEVMTASDGEQAIEQIERDMPDLILLDMLMPILGGEGFLDKSDILNKHKKTKIIIYSNLSDRETVQRLIERGVHAHILKSSMAPHQLADYIKQALA
ncbi:MAG: response regulator [Patescibacteria group bacterium]|nr:response regulator [Patescibacteria group bacterium]